MTKTTTTIWDPADHLNTADDIAAYLEAALQDGERPGSGGNTPTQWPGTDTGSAPPLRNPGTTRRSRALVPAEAPAGPSSRCRSRHPPMLPVGDHVGANVLGPESKEAAQPDGRERPLLVQLVDPTPRRSEEAGRLPDVPQRLGSLIGHLHALLDAEGQAVVGRGNPQHPVEDDRSPMPIPLRSTEAGCRASGYRGEARQR